VESAFDAWGTFCEWDVPPEKAGAVAWRTAYYEGRGGTLAAYSTREFASEDMALEARARIEAGGRCMVREDLSGPDPAREPSVSVLDFGPIADLSRHRARLYISVDGNRLSVLEVLGDTLPTEVPWTFACPEGLETAGTPGSYDCDALGGGAPSMEPPPGDAERWEDE
jgi:hypothetical protein